MYTTPRKVKQESRLRRSLSLTNSSRLNGGPTSLSSGDDNSGEYHRHLHDIEESKDSNTYFPFDGDLNLNHQRSRYSFTNGEGPIQQDSSAIPDLVDCSSSIDNSIVVHSTHHQSVHYQSNQQPPPYRVPPPGELDFDHHQLIVVTPHGVPDSPISLDSLQIHSSKFPIVKQVQVISQPDPSANSTHHNHHHHQQDPSSSPPRVPVPVLSPEYIKKFQNKKLQTKKQIAWTDTDQRRAFTLDSQTAKDIQQRLATYPITRANSADLGKAIQDFNDEQTRLMSSMQQGGGTRRLEGVDNPSLDIGSNGHIHHPHNSSLGYNNQPPQGAKMSGGYNYSDSSSTAQSLSLSSSNTDSCDTVIYKGPSQSTASIRDWQTQRSIESNGEFAHNGYRDSSGMMFDGRPSYQMQQQQQHPSSYPQMQYTNNGQQPQPTSGGTGYAIEYRHSQQQHQVQQNLSVHSIPSSSTGNNGGNNNMRSGNGTSFGSNPQLPTKSPMVSRKQFSTASGQPQTESNRVTFGSATANNPSSEPMSSEKTKDSKLFPTKTYNHIKDMISNRFGHGSVSSSSATVASNKGLNNSVNSSAIPSSHNNNNGDHNNSANSYIDLTMGVPASYPNSQTHNHPGNNNAQVQNSYNGRNGQSYYPQAVANGNIVPPNSYRSPNMNDRKNINTSFRKAIQQSTLKSNLTEDSLQLRPIMETSNSLHGGMQQFPGNNEPVQERAQKALDKLMEGNIGLPTTNGSVTNPSVNPGVYNRVQQFSSSSSGYPKEGPPRPLQPHGYPKMQLHHPQDSRPGFNVNPGPGSSNSNSSSGLQMVDSSLSSPGSYTGNRLLSGSAGSREEMHSLQQTAHSHNSQWAHLHQQNPKNHSSQDQPPPLPTSKKPDSAEGSINTIGLPSLTSVEIRENGDGSSATMDTNTGNMLLESTSSNKLCSKVKSDQLKQITTDLQNIALSVAAEQHLHNNQHHSSSSECEKGPQRVGSGQSHTTTDSGLGTVVTLTKSPLNSNSDPGGPNNPGRPNAESVSSGNDSEWVDLVEPEIRQILEIERAKSGKQIGRVPFGNNNVMINAVSTSTPAPPKQFQQENSLNNNNPNGNNNSTNLVSVNTKLLQRGSGIADISASPILHSKKPHSPNPSPKVPKKADLNPYNKKTIRSQSQELLAQAQAGPSTSQAAAASNKMKSPRVTAKVQRSNSGSGQRYPNRPQRLAEKPQKPGANNRQKEFTQNLKGAKITRNAMSKLGQLLHSLQDETGDLTSTTGLDFESAFDGHTEFTTDDDDLSTTIDTTDAHAIRRQLESLESMYTEVLKVLGEKKFSRNRYPPNTAELRNAKRRPYGSMSSLPSSVSSRPFREKSRKLDDKKKVKDLKSINRRFQRLESHVVTLARSVAHLSSEMRTQHLMVQEMESIRNELQQLRNQVVKNSAQTQSAQQNFNRTASGKHGPNPCANQTDWASFRNALPCRVRKLTKFFGDEPPLIRIFLKKLGYEKYAPAFEQERIGIMELPYLTEERLNKIGIPLGPRLRILQEAQMCLKPGYHGHQEHGHNSHHQNNHTGNGLSVYVV